MYTGRKPEPVEQKSDPPKMPEQAQRRAPMGQPQENPPDDSHALEELRQIIVGPEREDIAAMQDRLDDAGRRAEDVSSVVAEAIQIRRDQGGDRALAEALAPTIQETLRESVRKDPHVLADALFPVMGPAIRKSITETLRSMLESFNEALEHSLSAQGLQWRFEAFRTGKSFGEIVLLHSLLFRVEQVFLIHRETGLVLGHVMMRSITAQDPAMVAGMLSAIQQFVHDSFSSKNDETLGSLNVGELQVWVEESPDAVIAAVIRGHAPADYRLAMKEALEEIQQRYSSALENFQGDANPFRAASNRLDDLLKAQYREKKNADKKPRAAIAAGAILIAILIAWFGYAGYVHWKWSKILSAVQGQPGIVVTSHNKQGGRYHLQGLKDPLAPDPEKLLNQAGLSAENVEFDLAPYYSLDEAIIVKRAEQLLHPPAGVTFSMSDGELRAEGAAPPQWIARFRERAPLIAGVGSVNISHLQNSDLVQLNPLKATIESAVLLFPLGRAELESGQENTIAGVQNNIRTLLAQAAKLKEQTLIEVTGHSDSTGIEGTNLLLSEQRANQVRAVLLRSGIKPAILQVRGVGTSQPLRKEDTEEGRHLNRSVTFKVVFSSESSGN